ncbi:MAG: 2Fe-2S iron-sulfur cluster binding domain-containing protein, partial [Alphaproteobacteria bacterium]|nr:2Fe-2S iron-sulfur cluster binding domain-containing protein [Alphaproteobacteria bacterium]
MIRDTGRPADPGAETVDLTIDGETVTVPRGLSLLDAARSAGFRVPTLCDHPDVDVAGSCRVCVVEVEGQRTLAAACATPVEGPMTVHTHSPAVLEARRTIVDLIVSTHCGDCLTCPRDLNCELQRLAAVHGVRTRREPDALVRHKPFDESSPALTFDPDKCILCSRCVRVCEEWQGLGVLAVKGRGAEATVGPFLDLPMADEVCLSCGQCVVHCPTGALMLKDNTETAWQALADPERQVVIQTAPAPRAAIAEMFGTPPGTAMPLKLNTALRRLGFDRVFDTTFTADLTILEEATEFLVRLHKAVTGTDRPGHGSAGPLPQFTSCCPGWVTYLEFAHPDLLAHLSTAKSPQQMFGAVIKTHYAAVAAVDPDRIVSVSLMPCTAKKFEQQRPEFAPGGRRDVDIVLTTRELGQMLARAGIDPTLCPDGDFDPLFGDETGSGIIFGTTGGVMESALRTAVELLTGAPVERLFDHADIVPVRGFDGVKLARLTIGDVGPVPPLLRGVFGDFEWARGAEIRVAVAHAIGRAEAVLDDIAAGGPLADCHFVEVMACEGGCLGGGGQPVPTDAAIRRARAAAIYAEDAGAAVRKAHDNP